MVIEFAFLKLNQFTASKIGKYISFKHGLTKSFLFFPTNLKKQNFDYILINLVDTLPFAVGIAQKTGAKVIYDSQEYFKGQYAQLSLQQYNWVKKAEGNFVKYCPIILVTTNAMRERLQKEFVLNAHYHRVRNVPVKNDLNITKTQTATLKLVWHGLNIIPENIRGFHIILQAISICTTNVHLYLQGNISVKNKEILKQKLKQLNIISKVTVMPPANPDAIVESLVAYEIGIAGELAAEENQQLTSSNKLFEYIGAGMALIMPNLPGLVETVEEYKNAVLYQQGNAQDLANAIDQLNNNRNLLQQYQNASLKASHNELFW
jgi:glycosyltransferase involved in cell wall biosynthesis